MASLNRPSRCHTGFNQSAQEAVQKVEQCGPGNERREKEAPFRAQDRQRTIHGLVYFVSSGSRH